MLLTIAPEDWVSWDWRDILHDLSWPVMLTLLVLFLMLVHLSATWTDRTIRFGAARRQTRTFVREVTASLREGKLDLAIATAVERHRSHVARVVASTLRSYRSNQSFFTREEVVRCVERAARRSVAAVSLDLTFGLNGIASTAATAPLVGLFGTSIGLMDAFRGCIGQRTMCMVMTVHGMAEALITAALGLLVAIPSVWAHNYLRARMEVFTAEMENACLELLTYIGSRLPD